MGRFHTVGKMRIPELRNGDIERTSLLARLQQYRRPLLILAAGSGFGKTALLTQYAYTADTEVYWSDGRLNEPDAPGYTEGILILFGMERSDANKLTTRWSNSTSQLARLLLEHLPATPALLVLDSLEELSDEALNVIALLASHLPAGYQIALSLYELPNAFAPLITTDLALVLNETALAFTAEENRLLFEQHGSNADAQEAFERFEGWPVALAIVAQGDYLPHDSSELLIHHILAKLPPEIRSGLPELSLYPYWSSELARFTDPELPPDWLHQVIRAGLPAERLGFDRIRPHTLVKDVLTGELKLEPAKWQRHQQHLAEIHRQQGSTIRLIQTLTEAGATDAALELIREHLPDWRDRTDWMLMRHMLEPLASKLPNDLQAIYAIALQETRAVSEALVIFQELLRNGHADGNVYFGLAIRSYRSAQFDEAIALAKQGEPYADDRMSMDLNRVRAMALMNKSEIDSERSMSLRLEALKLAKHCVSLAGKLGKASGMIFALHVLMLAYQMLSLNQEAFALGERALSIARREGLMRKAMPVATWLAWTCPAYGTLTDDLLTTFEEIYNGSRLDYPLAITYIGPLLATIYELQGKPEAELEVLEESLEYARDFNPIQEAGILWSLSDHYRFKDDQEQASRYLQTVLTLAHEQDNPAVIDSCKRNKASLQVDVKNYEEAARILDDETDDSVANETSIIQGYLYRLQCYLQLGRDYSTVLEQLRRLIDDLELPWNSHTKTMVWFNLRDDLPRLKAAQACLLDHGFPPEYFVPNATDINQPAQQVQVRLFGFFSLNVDRTPIPLSPKQQEMVAYLAIDGPSNKSALMTALWPEKTTRQQHNNLKVQLNRLNQELRISAGSEGLFVYDRNTKMYTLAPHIELHSDLAIFAEGEYGRIQAIKKAINLYQQGFLPNHDSLWLDELRLELEDRFHHMIKRYVAETDFEQAWPTLVAAFGTSDRQTIQALLTV